LIIKSQEEFEKKIQLNFEKLSEKLLTELNQEIIKSLIKEDELVKLQILLI